jgi:hypothetical protein
MIGTTRYEFSALFPFDAFNEEGQKIVTLYAYSDSDAVATFEKRMTAEQCAEWEQGGRRFRRNGNRSTTETTLSNKRL